MRTVVAYDVSDDKRRDRLAKELARIGVRVQESVFECVIDSEEIADVVQHLTRWLDPQHDRLNVYRQCERCDTAAITFGQASPDPLDALFWLC